MLLVLDHRLQLKKTVQLDKNQFAKPEGIVFDQSDRMYISNEGAKSKPAEILVFNFKS